MGTLLKKVSKKIKKIYERYKVFKFSAEIYGVKTKMQHFETKSCI